jgi:polyphosphate kinase
MDSMERAAAILAGVGQDVAPARDRLGALPELPAGRFLDREESWLRFSQRVLELAEDPSVPLLERIRFESIFASALDEFFMVRIAGRIRRMATGLPVESVSGKAPDQIPENTSMWRVTWPTGTAHCGNRLLPALAESE